MGGVRHMSANWDRVLLDVCTQRDYLDPSGVLKVLNSQELIEKLRTVFRWVSDTRMAVVSSIESHRPTEATQAIPLHCVDGSAGQDKLGFTLLTPRLLVETDNYLSLPPDLRKNYRQLIFRKRTREFLSNPKAERFLTQLRPVEFVIVGVGLERGIKSLALGLLAQQKQVTVVTDACGIWSTADADLAQRQLAAKGVRLLTSEELIALYPTVSKIHRRRPLRRSVDRDRSNPTPDTPRPSSKVTRS